MNRAELKLIPDTKWFFPYSSHRVWSCMTCKFFNLSVSQLHRFLHLENCINNGAKLLGLLAHSKSCIHLSYCNHYIMILRVWALSIYLALRKNNCFFHYLSLSYCGFGVTGYLWKYLLNKNKATITSPTLWGTVLRRKILLNWNEIKSMRLTFLLMFPREGGGKEEKSTDVFCEKRITHIGNHEHLVFFSKEQK